MRTARSARRSAPSLARLGILAAASAFLATCDEVPDGPGSGIPPVILGGTSGIDASGFGRRDGGTGTVAIAILTPADGAIFRAGAAPEVSVRITPEVAGDPIDPQTVAFTLRNPREPRPAAAGALFGPQAQGEYIGRIDLANVPTGDYALAVTASTLGGAAGSASVAVKVDAGARIVIVSPRDGNSYKGSVLAQVVVDPSPFAPVSALEAFVGSHPVELRPVGSNAYEGLIEFGKFDPPLDREQAFRVAVRNGQGTRSEAQVRFTVDNAGPIFDATEPAEGAVVGGVIRVRAHLADPAGVLGGSVIAVIGNKADVTFKLDLQPEAGQPGTFSALFDTAKLTRCKPSPDQSLCIVFPNLSFRAADALGNETTLSYDFAVDNHPPVLDLDPPPDMRIVKFDHGPRCSWAFDPVGNYVRLGDMPNDGCAVPQVFDLRARIEDQGNRADGLKISPISGVDVLTTAVYVLDDTTQPLIVDVDRDGVCDAINPRLVPTTMPPQQSNEVLMIRLSGVPPKGEADFTPDPSLATPAGMSAYPGCLPGIDIEPPLPLCVTQTVTIGIGQPSASGPAPAIWGLDPVTEKDDWCLGSQFDSFANEIAEGWACVAAGATDRNGNASVSAPLRVWIQRRGLEQRGASCPAPPPTAGPPPDCTASFDRNSDALLQIPCHSRRFGAREVRYVGSR